MTHKTALSLTIRIEINTMAKTKQLTVAEAQIMFNLNPFFFNRSVEYSTRATFS